MDLALLKTHLINHCDQFIADRINNIQKAIDESQKAANEETKSSAGDKYETGRAMMQLNKENNLKQLAEAQQLKNAFSSIKNNKISTTSVTSGNLVVTNQGIFYIAISIGLVNLMSTPVFVISAQSPIGNLLLNKKTGESFSFNSKQYLIEVIH